MRRPRKGLVAACAAALCCWAVPSAAHGSVTVGDPVVVTAPDGSSISIARDPVRVSFFDEEGKRALAQTAPGAEPLTVPPVPHRQFGLATPPSQTAYRPFGFLVGSHQVTQATAVTQWYATLDQVVRSGTVYGATEVTDAERDGDGAVLTLATDDPSGREIVVRVAPGAKGGIDVSAKPQPASGVAAMADSFASPKGEAFHGFGGRHNYLDQRGKDFYGWLQQQNVSSGSANGLTAPTNPEGDRYMFPNGESAAYYVHAAFVSDAGYGFLLDRNEISHWRMASDRADAWQVEVAGQRLDYTVMPGSLRESVANVSELNGRHRLPPAWAQGALLVRSVKFPVDNASDYLAVVRDDIRQIEETGTPTQAYGIEGWEFLSDAELKSVIADLREIGVRPMLYFRLFVGEDTIGTDDPADYAEALEKGYVATRANGEPYTFTSNFFRNAAMIDYTDPAAVDWWQGRIREALKLGAEGFMQDFGEQVMQDMHFEDGSTGKTMHNRLAVLAHRATREEVDRWEKKTGDEIFFYTRGGYSGTPGAAAYESANFAGDSTTDWTRSAGLASLATDMLNRAVAGNYGFTTDIGGYFDIGPYEPTTKELFWRWTQWAALSPLFRLHGSVLAGTHMPWTFDAETVELYKRYAKLHLEARPYTRDLWRKAEENGIPPTRPMWLQYPDDEAAEDQDQQWMLGSKVLVAPVVVEGATSRQVYFPAGCWEHPETGETYNGPASRNVEAPLDLLPYFFKCGEDPFATESSGSCVPLGGGSDRGERLRGTAGRDEIRGRGGKDRIKGRGGADCLFGGTGQDRIQSGRGADTVRCGGGRDTVWAGKKDRVRGCERVRRTRG